MPDVTSTLAILVDVVHATEGAAKLRDVGKAGKEAGGDAKKAGGSYGKMALDMTAAVGGAVALQKGLGFMKDAAGAAVTLAKATSGVQRTTGMDTKTASAWVSMTKERGIETAALNKGFTTFSKQIVGAKDGSKAAAGAFDKLGISAATLKGMNTQDAILATADALKAMPAGADKAALAQQLFGKQAQALGPLLNSGSDGIKEQMKAMDKFGLTIDDKGKKKSLEFAKSQREMGSTMEGIKLTIGQALVPALAAVAAAIAPVITFFAQLLQHVPALTPIILALAAALAGLVLFSTIAAAIGVILPMLPLLAAGFTAVWAAITGPVGLVVIGVLALIAVFVVLYNKVGWFHDAVDAAFGAIKNVAVGAFNALVGAAQAAFNWIKGNWPLLLGILTGPFGLAIAIVVTHFGKIKQVAVDAFNAIKGAVTGAASTISGALGGAFNTVKGAVQGVIDTVDGLIQKVKEIPSNIGGKLKGGGVPFVPGIAGGGTLAVGGVALVGERGPELLQLPTGARVTPLAAGTQTPVDLGGFGGEIHVHLDVDGRELAHVVANQTADRQAAR